MNIPSPLSSPHSESLAELSIELDELFETALAGKLFSGASLAVAGPDRLLFERMWGKTFDGGTPVDEHTLFDLASLTKPLVTASLCLQALARGLMGLEDRLQRFMPPSWIPASKRDITVRHLLGHSSGLPAYAPLFLDLLGKPPEERRGAVLRSILDAPLSALPGKVSLYSDLGFILLGMLVEELMGAPLDVLSSATLSSSLFSRDLLFNRLTVSQDPAVAPAGPSGFERVFVATEQCPWRRRLLVGEVHDENAYSLGGVAGHAGLFGTAAGVVEWMLHLWRLYRGDGGNAPADSRLPDLLREFWDRSPTSPEGTWVLGFDTPTPSRSSAGRYFSPRSVGHLGFTGTSFWLDLERGILVVLLTNRVYPTRRDERIKEFRPLLHDIVMKGIHEA